MMKRAKGVGVDGDGSEYSMGTSIYDLPEELMQRIVYFLSQGDAVRTSVLSKSWRHVWCTRPNLDFSETAFRGNKHEFLSAVEKTLQRYCDPVDAQPLSEFHLSISLPLDEHHRDDEIEESVLLLDKWIPIVLTTTMGATLDKFRLSIVAGKKYPSFVYDLILPTDKKIQCERLRVLSLQNVFIKQECFDKMVSNCPLLTTLSLKECRGLKTIKLEKRLYKHLNHFTFINHREEYDDDERTIVVVEIHDDVQTLETIKIDFVAAIHFHGGHKFNNLKYVTLKPRSSRYNRVCCIDAPNLLYFEYSGASVITYISFAPACTRSNITLYINLYINGEGRDYASSWLFNVSRLLQALRQSKISLIVDINHRVTNFIPQDTTLVLDFVNGGGNDNNNNKRVVVEHLVLRRFRAPPLASTINGLLCICRPINITHPMFKPLCNLKKEVEQTRLTEYLRSLVSEKQESRQYLEAVSIQRLEKFDQRRSKWQPIQWTGFLEYPHLNNIRFQLEWSQS